MIAMTQLLLTLLLVAVPFGLALMPAMEMWNNHSRLDAVGFVVLVVFATIVWLAAWDMAGGLV